MSLTQVAPRVNDICLLSGLTMADQDCLVGNEPFRDSLCFLKVFSQFPKGEVSTLTHIAANPNKTIAVQ
jgi:hypothetical protein